MKAIRSAAALVLSAAMIITLVSCNRSGNGKAPTPTGKPAIEDIGVEYIDSLLDKGKGIESIYYEMKTSLNNKESKIKVWKKGAKGKTVSTEAGTEIVKISDGKTIITYNPSTKKGSSASDVSGVINEEGKNSGSTSGLPENSITVTAREMIAGQECIVVHTKLGGSNTILWISEELGVIMKAFSEETGTNAVMEITKISTAPIDDTIFIVPEDIKLEKS